MDKIIELMEVKLVEEKEKLKTQGNRIAEMNAQLKRWRESGADPLLDYRLQASNCEIFTIAQYLITVYKEIDKLEKALKALKGEEL